jgi:hypothetical protein
MHCAAAVLFLAEVWCPGFANPLQDVKTAKNTPTAVVERSLQHVDALFLGA